VLADHFSSAFVSRTAPTLPSLHSLYLHSLHTLCTSRLGHTDANTTHHTVTRRSVRLSPVQLTSGTIHSSRPLRPLTRPQPPQQLVHSTKPGSPLPSTPLSSQHPPSCCHTLINNNCSLVSSTHLSTAYSHLATAVDRCILICAHSPRPSRLVSTRHVWSVAPAAHSSSFHPPLLRCLGWFAHLCAALLCGSGCHRVAATSPKVPLAKDAAKHKAGGGAVKICQRTAIATPSALEQQAH